MIIHQILNIDIECIQICPLLYYHTKGFTGFYDRMRHMESRDITQM